jgi:hypothetical protein
MPPGQSETVSKTPLFSRLFGPSPISPIQEHMETCERCVLALVPFFDAVSASDWADAEKCYRVVSNLEGDADELKKRVRLNYQGVSSCPCHATICWKSFRSRIE